jgi:predicted CopG family antitoxin
MATKTITITTDAYLAMKREKLPGESFSDLIRRKFKGGSARALVGLLSEAEGEEMVRGIEERRQERAARRARMAHGRP